MRTTLDIDADVLLAIKDRARREKRSAGAIISELARASLTGSELEQTEDFFGFITIPSRGTVITAELVDQIQDESNE